MTKRLLALGAILLFAGVLFAGEGPPRKAGIRFPETPSTPTPKTDPTATPKLTLDTLYVVDSDTPVLYRTVPAGLVKVTKEVGTISIRAKFVGGSGGFERREFKGKNVLLIEAVATGKVTLIVVPVGATKDEDIVEKTIDVDAGEGPRPPPDPPKPPPDPPVPPKPPEPPPSPSPIPVAGFRVLIVYETATLMKLPPAQLAIRTSKQVRDYLKVTCTDDPSAADRKAYRIWDPDTDASAPGLEVWAAALKRPRTSLPWIVIGNHPHGGYEGPLPANVAETLALLKKHAEKGVK